MLWFTGLRARTPHYRWRHSRSSYSTRTAGPYAGKRTHNLIKKANSVYGQFSIQSKLNPKVGDVWPWIPPCVRCHHYIKPMTILPTLPCVFESSLLMMQMINVHSKDTLQNLNSTAKTSNESVHVHWHCGSPTWWLRWASCLWLNNIHNVSTPVPLGCLPKKFTWQNSSKCVWGLR